MRFTSFDQAWEKVRVKAEAGKRLQSLRMILTGLFALFEAFRRVYNSWELRGYNGKAFHDTTCLT